MKTSITLEEARKRRQQFGDTNTAPFTVLSQTSKIVASNRKIQQGEERVICPEEEKTPQKTPQELAAV